MKNRILLFAGSLFFCVFVILGVSIQFINNLKIRNEESKRILIQRIGIKSLHLESQKLLKAAFLFSRGNKIQAFEEFYDASSKLKRISIQFSDPVKQREMEALRNKLLSSVEKLISSNQSMDSVEFELGLNEVISLSKLLELSETSVMLNLEKLESDSNLAEQDEVKYSLFVISIVIFFALYIVYRQLKRGARAILELESNKDEVQARLQEASRLAFLGEMSASIAHEIKNPLTVLVGKLNLLKRHANAGKPASAADQIEFAEKSLAIITRISRTIQSVQRAARNEANERTEISIQELLKENFDLCLDKATANKVELTEQNDSSFDKVFGNSVELSQVFLNLINNAIDATENLEEKWVKVQISNDESNLIIRIVDSGKGIPKEIQSKLFKNFFTTKPVGKGTGLGLAICQRIIAAHSGSIKIDNSAANTTFLIRMPLVRRT